MKNHYFTHPVWGGVFIILIFLTVHGNLFAQKNKPSADLQQFRNGSFTSPVNPGTWTTGNNGSSNSHYAEAMSAPYRVIMNNLAPNSQVTLTLEYDVQHSGRMALDYLTSYDRIEPHVATFGHTKEEINPTVGTSLFQSPPESPNDVEPIPLPVLANSPVAGQPQNSFNNVAGTGQAQMAIWNGAINSINYVGGMPDLSDPANQSQRIQVDFTTGPNPSKTVILAWGGHLASRNDWGLDENGEPMSAGGISGSPYHMRLISWNFGNLGNQDLSLSIELESAPDVPGTIENFSATAVSTDQIDLNWDLVVSSLSLNYILERATSAGGPWTQIANLPQGTTNFSDTGLTEFTRYFYRVFATNSDGTSQVATAVTRTFSPLSSATNSNGKSRDKIGWELDALFRGIAGETPAEFIYQFNENGDVLIEIIAFKNPSTVEAVINLLKTKYGRVDSDFLFNPQFYIDNNRNLIDLYLQVPFLDDLNEEDIINFARPVFRTFNSSIGVTGVLSQGDSTQTSQDVRASFKVPDSTGTKFVDGSGVKIAVLSNSFNTESFSGTDSRYVTDQKNGDLPGPFNPNYPDPVEVLAESSSSDTDEGRAMLHIMHDTAPGAELGFYSGTRSLNTFAQGIETASLAGYDITVDDITFMFESFFRHEGFVFNTVVDHVNREDGNMHFSSAGNFDDKAKAGVLDFDPLPGYSDIYTPGTTAYIHDFGGGDYSLDIFANTGQYVLALQWDEAFSSLGDPTGAVSDIDFYIVDDSLQLIAGSNRINILGDAAELLVLNASAARPAKLIITYEGATPPAGLEFRLVAFKTSGDGDGLVFTEPISGSTVTGHAAFDIDNSITTGASFYGFYKDSADIEPFSSLGILGEVDITGPDGANTNVNTIGTDILFDPDIFNNFFGTSASVNHVAASYALMLQAAPLWYPAGIPAEKFDDPTFSTPNPADQARGLFTQTAFSIGDPAKSGAGLIQVEEAFRQIATQTSVLNSFTYDTSKVISVDSVLVTLQGDYFTPDSQVLLNGDTVETTYISETELQVLIPPFSGSAGIAVDSKSSTTPSGADGGESNPINLLEGRRAITITADDAFRTFGQDFDNLTFSVSGLIGDETYDSLGLPDIVLSSTAVGPFPDIGNYIITPSLAEPLSPEMESMFIVALKPGVLSITPLEMTIQPMDTTMIYGETPPFVMNYIYDTTGISNNTEFLDFLRSEHESTYLTDTTGTGLVNRFSAVVNRFSAVVNENPDLVDELIELLTNSNWMATETSIENRFSAVVNAIEFDADQLIDYLVDPLVGNSASIENRFSAVVNGDDLVNGSTVIWDPVENRFSAVVNRFSAVVNRFSAVVNVPLGTENDSTDLSQTLAIVDAEDGTSETEPIDTIKAYSINVVTGLSVTTSPEERHYMLSGAALAPVFTNCILNFQPGFLLVNPAPMVVDLDDGDVPIELNFGDPTPVFTSTTDTPAYNDEISINYHLNPEPVLSDPVSAGTYAIEQSASITNSEGMDVTSNYNVTYINGTLVVNPGILILDTEDVFTNEGTDLSTLSFSTTISGLVQDIEEVFPGGPNYSYASPLYESAGRGPGSFPVETTVSPEPVNYTVVDNGAQLFVNLVDGKKLRVYLDCIAQNKGQTEYGFTAYFHYENDNAMSIFIGPDENFLEGDAFDASGLPFEFLPGSHQVGIEFEGSLRWKVYSFGSINPSSVEVNSDNYNSNNRCRAKDVVINGRTANPNPESEPAFSSEEVQYYPNPVDDYLVVRVNQGFTSRDYQLYNSQGILYHVNTVIDPVQSTAEFDLSNFETGLYLLKLNIDGTNAVIRILRQ